MAAAYKCDRCGTYSDYIKKSEKPTTISFLIRLANRNVVADTTRKMIDLCPACIEKLDDWILNRE